MIDSILITGGSGYLGHGLATELLKRDVRRICIYSRDEVKQARMRAEFKDDPRLRFFLGDVRDLGRLKMAMRGVQYVVHAAALKRVEAIEYNVIEGIATNVIGSENVMHAALDTPGMIRCVLVSTDKACEPTTTYGLTKAMAERVFLTAHHYAGGSLPAFAVVRYGNVWGSTGSVIPIWRERIAKGEVCEIRDPDATRFWMTRQEAVEFVLDAVKGSNSGELRTPDLPAYRLGDLAAAMGVHEHEYRVTALGQGEKPHESMLPGQPSNLARRMTVQELTEALQHV